MGALGVRAVIEFGFDSKNKIFFAGGCVVNGVVSQRGKGKSVTDAQYKECIITLHGVERLGI